MAYMELHPSSASGPACKRTAARKARWRRICKMQQETRMFLEGKLVCTVSTLRQGLRNVKLKRFPQNLNILHFHFKIFHSYLKNNFNTGSSVSVTGFCSLKKLRRHLVKRMWNSSGKELQCSVVYSYIKVSFYTFVSLTFLTRLLQQ